MKQVFQDYKNFKVAILQEFADKDSDKYEIPVSVLSEVFRTKEELYNLLDKQGEYFLPPINSLKFEFLRKFLVGEKKLYKKNEIRHLEKIPRFEEFKTEKIWNIYKNDPLVLPYIPLNGKQLPDRRYLLSIINTIHNGSVHKMIGKALELRAGLKIKSTIEIENKVQVSKELTQLLFSSRMISGNFFIIIILLNLILTRKKGENIESYT